MTVQERWTDLPTVGSATMTDIINAVQGYVSPAVLGTSVQETLQQVYNLFQSNIILFFSGNPNGHVAGTTYTFCWDTLDSVLYLCTTSGTTSTAVWTAVSTNLSVIPPSQGGTGVASPTAHTLPVAEGSSNFHFLGPLSNGQLLVGSSGADPVPATLTAGTNISIVNGAGSITVNATGLAGIGWVVVSGTSQAMSADMGYIANNAGLVTLTLPLTAAVGTIIYVQGMGSGGWSIAQNAGQNIQVGSAGSTIGAGGSVSSTNQWDSITLLCVNANLTWTSLGAPQSSGLTIV